MRTRGAGAAIALSLACLVVTAPGQAADPAAPIIGFPGETARAQRALEADFAGRIDRERIRGTLRDLSSKPHHVGSPRTAEIAHALAERFRSWGFDARVETFYGLVSTPEELVLEMLEPRAYRAPLADGPSRGAPPQASADSLPPYSMFSKDGDVTAEAVYVNYGAPEDYEFLVKQDIDVRGRIVIARYGKSWRGAKLHAAAAHGAVGAVFYSDPAQGGYAEGAVYPDGPFLPAEAAQRGSVGDLPRRAGDPLTPGKGAIGRPASFSPDDVADWISPIPVQPVSAKEIEPIMAALAGPAAPDGWRGGLPVEYRIGDGTVKLRLKVEQDWAVVPLHDVVAMLEGSDWPDQWVMRGNNHDAWNFGAEDALSGLAAMLEEARAIGAMAKEGWRPKRSLVYLAWDGEEAGLFGSTEWVETHADELRRKAVVYLNSGPLARGYFDVGGSHSLHAFVDGVARDLSDPSTGKPVAGRVDGATTGKFPLKPLGMSSDYGAFLQHLGIASLDMTFGGESQNACYHSVCDDFGQFEKFSDPGFAYSAAVAEAGGRMMLRLGEAEVLPFDFTGMAEAIDGYADAAESLAAGLYGPPAVEFAPLRRAQHALAAAASRFSAARAAYEAGSTDIEPGTLARVNAILAGAEQALAPKEGLPGRPWYRHLVYAPSFDTGYEAATLPGVGDALGRRDREATRRAIASAAEAIGDYATAVDGAAGLLSPE